MFFFKQKTAYEVRISDWSSDVCSSDLVAMARGARVEACDDAGQPRDERCRQFAAPRHPVEQTILVEACHFEDGLDEASLAVEREPAVGAAHDPAYTAVDLRRRPAVEFELALAAGKAQLGGGKVEIGPPHGLLQLPDQIGRAHV